MGEFQETFKFDRDPGLDAFIEEMGPAFGISATDCERLKSESVYPAFRDRLAAMMDLWEGNDEDKDHKIRILLEGLKDMLDGVRDAKE